VSEAAVVGVPHEKWQERPIAFVVPVEGTDEETLREGIYEMLGEEYPKWWLPDAVEFIDAVPKTATGKFSKKDLREEYDDAELFEGQTPEEAAPDDD
jgi:fatty-acyl-CoA synthase